MHVIALPDRVIADHGSTGMTLHPVPAPPSDSARHVVVLELGAGGRIGRHPAAGWQVLVVTSGSGEVSGSDGVRVPIHVGEAAVWAPGEEHETSTHQGLVATILESDEEPDLAGFESPG